MKKIILLVASIGLLFASAVYAGGNVQVLVKNTGEQTISFYFPANVWLLNVAPGKSREATIPQHTSGTVYISTSPKTKNLISCGQYQFDLNGRFDGFLNQTPASSSQGCSYSSDSARTAIR